MKFLSMRELRTATGEIKDILADDGKIIVTSSGKPAAFMVAIDEDSFEDVLDDWRRMAELRALRRLQDHVILEKLTEAEQEANDPNTVWLSHDEVFGKMRRKYGYTIQS